MTLTKAYLDSLINLINIIQTFDNNVVMLLNTGLNENICIKQTIPEIRMDLY